MQISTLCIEFNALVRITHIEDDNSNEDDYT